MAVQNVQVDGLAELQKSLGLVQREVFPQAAARAINRGVDRLATITIRHVAKRMGVAQSSVRSRVVKIKVSKQGIDRGGIIRVRGNAVGLDSFGARETKGGISSAPWGTRRVFPDTFFVEIKGIRHVMKRAKIGGTRVGRMPIERLLGPGVARTAWSDEAQAERDVFLAGFLVPEVMKQLDLLLSKKYR